MKPVAHGDPRSTHAHMCEPWTQAASGLKYVDSKVGEGPSAKAGDTVKVHYTGSLTNGDVFDSSKNRGEPITFELGAGIVIAGWDEGIAGMKVGGTRKLYIPASLGYGSTGAGDAIPPDSDLIFETELVGVATGMEALAAKVPGGMPNLIIGTLLILSFIPYFLPEELRTMLPGY